MDKQLINRTRNHKTDVHEHNRSFWDKFWRDKNDHIAIAQKPNIWLIAWLIFELISLFSASHLVENMSWWLATAVLSVWALLEIFQGVDYFRRLLGLFIFVMTVMTVFGIGL
jgi:hypothetical protein